MLNDCREMIRLQLTRTTAFEEIRDVIGEPGLKLVIVDDCCKVRALYQSVFPGVKVKLDLFHGVQRVMRTIPKGTEFSTRFSKEFGQIFCANGDFGDRRTSPTPRPNILNENLNNFLKGWKDILEGNNLGNTLIEIENVRKHIDNGCNGTECSESLHHTLNNSLVAGVTMIGPE